MAIEFAQRVRRIPHYPLAGGYATREPLVRLASNESPFGPSAPVRQAISRELGSLNRYPDPSCTRLRAALSRRYDVPASRIAVGNGSCDLLLGAGEALLEPGAELVYAWPSFSEYRHVAGASGARAIEVPLDSEDRHDLEAMLSEVTVATRLVLVCNPNNPTGTALPFAQLADFVEQVPHHACVLLDEAYCEFNLLEDPDATLELLERRPNLVLLRTFSKVHGLAGLRVGYGLCGSEELAAALGLVRQPFSVNALAQAAATESVAHQDEVIERVSRTVAERLVVEDALRAMGLSFAQSQANFSWIHLGEQHDEEQVMRGLAERGVLVRAGIALGSEQPALRVTYGTPEEDARFLDALAEALGLLRAA